MSTFEVPPVKPAGAVFREGQVVKTEDLRVNLTRDEGRRLKAGLDPLGLIEDVGRTAARSDNLQEALRPALESISTYLGFVAAYLYVQSKEDPSLLVADAWFRKDADNQEGLRESASELMRWGEGAAGRALETKRVVTMDASDLAGSESLEAFPAKAGVRGVTAVPVMTGPKVLAVIDFFSAEAAVPDDQTVELLEKMGRHLGRTIEHELWDRKLAEAAAYERHNLAMELHDGLAQQLAGIKLLSESLLGRLKCKHHDCSERLGRICEYMENALATVRATINCMSPKEIQSDGLPAALSELAQNTTRRYGLECVLHCDQTVDVADCETATNLLRIAQEAVHNAIKHADCRQILIVLRMTNGKLVMEISDDGGGFSPEKEPEGMGLRIMRYRAGRIGAVLSFGPNPQGGNIVRCAYLRK